MKTPTSKRLFLLFISLYIVLYFSWLIAWSNNDQIMTLGGNLFSSLGYLIATIWLFKTWRASKGNEKIFWLLLMVGTLSYGVAQFLWTVYETSLLVDVPFPGPPNFFYVFQIIFYLAAFLFKLIKETTKPQFIKVFFDAFIIMVVAATFSWHFLLSPIINMTNASLYPLIFSIAYPIGNLALLLCILSIYLGIQKSNFHQNLVFLSLGLFSQIIAGSFYLHLTLIGQYNSAIWADPLFALGALFIGFAGLLRINYTPHQQTVKLKTESTPQVEFLRLSLPYATVLILVIFMASRSSIIDPVRIGSGISILLVVFRQIFIILENQQLLQKYHEKTEQLDLSEQRYKSLFEYHPDAVYSLDLTGHFESANPSSSALFGYEKDELIGLSSSLFIEPGMHEHANFHLEKALKGQAQTYELCILNRFNQSHYLSVTNIPIMVQNNIVGIFGIAKDITANKKNEEKIHFLAYHDSLTGLANRLYFGESLKKAILEAALLHETFAVLFIDLDHFKQINDTLGHDVGDQLLISVADRLTKCVREKDVVSRQGGDEFTILLRNIHDLETAAQLAEDILNSLKQPHYINDSTLFSLPSIGIAIYPLDSTTPIGLMKKADKAMYQVKANGKGHYQFNKETI